MKANTQTAATTIPAQLVTELADRLEGGKRVRHALPRDGRIHIDRPLPFLCVYRLPPRRLDVGTDQLITGQPAYILAPGQRSFAPGLTSLVTNVARTQSGAFGRTLLVEVWADTSDDESAGDSLALPRPAFRVSSPDRNTLSNTLTTLETELAAIRIRRQRAIVEETTGGRPAPPRMLPLLDAADAAALGVGRIGIAVRPIYRQAETGELLPLILAALVRDFNRALQRAFFTFTRTQTPYQPRHYQMLGRQATVKAVWHVDKQLSAVGDSFDFLLQVTPINPHAAWRLFKRRGFARTPVFRYRPQTADPALLKRQLWGIKVEHVEDPTLQHLFHEKRKELDLQISMLSNINRPEFLLQSRQLYGQPDARLVATAAQLLAAIPAGSREISDPPPLDATAFAHQARAEIARYQAQTPGFDARVVVQKGLAGLMVSQGNLLVGQTVNIAASRVLPLLSHELSVHSLTYFNGRAQRFTLLASGLAGYEELQEGLAVLSEYMVGGLSRPRIRLLAGRVLAADALVNGATFIETFRLLTDTHRFPRRTGYTITMRTYRAGGLTKDAVYLRGLIALLDYLTKEPLTDLFFVGKIAGEHIPIIEELQRRRVLEPPRWRPHFLTSPESAAKLELLGRGLTVLDLVKGSKKRK